MWLALSAEVPTVRWWRMREEASTVRSAGGGDVASCTRWTFAWAGIGDRLALESVIDLGRNTYCRTQDVNRVASRPGQEQVAWQIFVLPVRLYELVGIHGSYDARPA
jgi:hypothetical protein